MENGHIDIIEVFLKKDLDIPLTEKEKDNFEKMDNEDRETVFDLINSYSYIEELDRVMNNIKEKSSNLSISEQQEIFEKCEMKKQKLEETKLKQSKKMI